MSAYPGILMSGNGTSAPLDVSPPPNMQWQAPPAYSLGLILTYSSGASLTATVQVTADPIPGNGGYWNNHDVIASVTGSTNSNIAYPVTAVRLVITNYTQGSVNLGVAQWP